MWDDNFIYHSKETRTEKIRKLPLGPDLCGSPAALGSIGPLLSGGGPQPSGGGPRPSGGGPLPSGGGPRPSTGGPRPSGGGPLPSGGGGPLASGGGPLGGGWPLGSPGPRISPLILGSLGSIPWGGGPRSRGSIGPLSITGAPISLISLSRGSNCGPPGPPNSRKRSSRNSPLNSTRKK